MWREIAIPSPSSSIEISMGETHTKLVRIPPFRCCFSHCYLCSLSPSLSLPPSPSLSLLSLSPSCTALSLASSSYPKTTTNNHQAYQDYFTANIHDLPAVYLTARTVNPAHETKTHKPNKGTTTNKTPWRQIMSLQRTHSPLASRTIIPELHMCNLATLLYICACINTDWGKWGRRIYTHINHHECVLQTT